MNENQDGDKIPERLLMGKRICGCKEPCFEKGGQWGHFEGVMCANLYEKDWYENGVSSIVEWCDKYDCSVQSYSTQLQYLNARWYEIEKAQL